MRSKRIHSPTWKHLAVATFLAFVFCPSVTAQINARPIEIAVVGFGDSQTARKVTEQIGESFRANQLRIIDSDRARAAAKGVGYNGSLNMTLEEARNLASAIGCDFFISGDAQTLRRSPSTSPVYFESYASLFLVSARTGKLVFWERQEFRRPTAIEAERTLLNALFAATTRARYQSTIHRIAEEERNFRATAIDRTAPVIELMPDAETSSNIRAPRPFRRPKPPYPEAAAHDQVEATVDVLADIDANGKVGQIETSRWAGYGLDESVINTVQQIDFFPAMRDGVAIPMRVLLRYNFRKPPKPKSVRKTEVQASAACYHLASRGSVNQSMLYLSQVLGRPILDLEGERVATLKDVIVRLGQDDYPPVAGFVARYRRRDFFLSRWRISDFGEHGVKLDSDILDLRPFMRREGEVLLARDVLDKQLIDVDGKRVVRVNDVQIIPAANEWRVTGADVSLAGLWRRLAPSFMRRGNPVEVIDWADVGYLATDAATVQLKSSRGKLTRLHPVEIARLAAAFSYQQGAEIVESLDDETAAETLEEMAAERQAQIIGDMDEERAADILEHMSPDEAADVLGDLPEEKAEDLLHRMDDEEQSEVAELLPYEDDTAGGLMTTEFVTLPRDLTVGEALARLREMAETPNMIYYLYVVEHEQSWKLVGVIALRSLILARTSAPLEQVMRTDVQVAHPDDNADEVAHKIAEYNLLALPVLDEAGDILGIVTVDDAIEHLLPRDWRERLPRLLG